MKGFNQLWVIYLLHKQTGIHTYNFFLSFFFKNCHFPPVIMFVGWGWLCFTLTATVVPLCRQDICTCHEVMCMKINCLWGQKITFSLLSEINQGGGVMQLVIPRCVEYWMGLLPREQWLFYAPTVNDTPARLSRTLKIELVILNPARGDILSVQRRMARTSSLSVNVQARTERPKQLLHT